MDIKERRPSYDHSKTIDNIGSAVIDERPLEAYNKPKL
jgi:hypothetical protein